MKFLQDILIPQKINSYYLLPQRVIGFDISKTTISATKILYSGTTIFLEKFLNQAIENDTNKSYEQRVADTLRILIKQMGDYDIIRTALSSSYVVFKELTLPFTDPEKISMILPFELEPYLPFPVSQSVSDFIIINKSDDKITLLAAAVKKDYIQEHLNFFHQADLNPHVITIDLFDLYGLYNVIPAYIQSPMNRVLIDLEVTATRIAIIVNGKLAAVRALPRGTSHWIKELAKQLNISPQDAHEKLVRFGLNGNKEEGYIKAIEHTLQSFIREIRFTLSSSLERIPEIEKLDQILILGSGSEIEGIAQYMQTHLTIESELFDCNSLLSEGMVVLKVGNKIPRSNILSLGTALISPTMENFNLRQEEFAPVEKKLFEKQFFVFVALLTTFFSIFLFHTFWQIRKLSKAKSASTAQIIKTLRDANLTQQRNLQKALTEAEQYVSNQESIWFAFSSQTRFSILKYLQDLSIALDRTSIGLTLERLIISEQDSTITLQGSVRDFEALKLLEKELKQSNLFIYVPSLQDTKFNITIPFKKNGEQ